MLKNAQVHWAFCRRKSSVNVGSGITSDTVLNDEEKDYNDK